MLYNKPYTGRLPVYHRLDVSLDREFDLSDRAALTVQAGLRAEQVRAVSYGEAQDRLIASGGHGPGDEGWQNRRVALVIDYSGD